MLKKLRRAARRKMFRTASPHHTPTSEAQLFPEGESTQCSTVASSEADTSRLAASPVLPLSQPVPDRFLTIPIWLLALVDGEMPCLSFASPSRETPASELLSARTKRALLRAEVAGVSERRAWLKGAATESPPISSKLWVAYRRWVDTEIGGVRAELFHRFLLCHTFGIGSFIDATSGSEVADIVACLAVSGRMFASQERQTNVPPGTMLAEWLRMVHDAFGTPFNAARGRCCVGYRVEEEGGWSGAYDFVQLCDPQLGMFRSDQQWGEELAMLKLAVTQINKLRHPLSLNLSHPLSINSRPTLDQLGGAHLNIVEHSSTLNVYTASRVISA